MQSYNYVNNWDYIKDTAQYYGVPEVKLTKRKLRQLERLQLSSSIVNTEARLYLNKYKDTWVHKKELFKVYYRDEDEYLMDKMHVILQLLMNKELLDMEELVLPNSLVTVDDKISGYSMPFIENNINYTILLKNPKIKLDLKLKFLKEILKVLKKLADKKELEDNFFLGDIHEANFLWDMDEQNIKVVDIDSAYINNSPISISKFLTFNEKLENVSSKYVMDEESERIIPSRETTIASFWFMFLDTISNGNSYKWSLNEYYAYISFLKKQGIDEVIIEELNKMYVPSSFADLDESTLDYINTDRDYTLQRARIPSSDGSYYK